MTEETEYKRIHDSQTNIRINGLLVYMATKIAGEQGMSYSEFVRSAIREKIGRSQKPLIPRT